KLERAIQKLQSIPPGAPPRKIIPILQAVIEQLDDTIAQLQAAIMQLEALQGPEGDCPPGANIPGAISEIGQAINATSIARQIVMELLQNPNLPPDVVQSMIGQAINQSSAAIGHAAAAINALFGGPPLCKCPLGATDEGEPCGADTNGGCNSTPVTFGAIACSETICGTGWADGGTRDTDWYEVSLADCTVLTATLTSAFDGVVFIVDGIPNCAPVVVGQTGSSNQCTPIAPASAIVQPGTYVIFVAPATFEGVPCGSGANDYFVTLDCSPCPGGPPNDHCADRIVIEAGSIDYDTTGADTDGVAHAACQFDGQTYHDIWFNYVAAVDGTLLVTTCNTASYDTDLAVYLGCDPSTCPPGDSQLLACNDDAPGCAGFTSEVTIPVSCGQCYKIRVGGWNPGDAGAGTLTLVEAGTPCGGCPCQWDLDGDCHVGPADLAILLAAWNQPYGPPDLAALLAEWGCSDG
ncbi:MAG: hypothetical protein KDA25_05230, partial [Phycisphaerales bacterium]|nr:hypothetical protein [Phycisphaerales bacterium]